MIMTSLREKNSFFDPIMNKMLRFHHCFMEVHIKIMDSGKNNARTGNRTTDRSCLKPVTKVGNNIADSHFINRIIAKRRQALINLYSYLF